MKSTYNIIPIARMEEKQVVENVLCVGARHQQDCQLKCLKKERMHKVYVIPVV